MWSFFSKDPSLTNFEIQEHVSLDAALQQKTIWTLNNAKRKGTTANQPPTGIQSNNEAFTAFIYNVRAGNEAWAQPAKNCLKRMKMTRHPNILMFQDGIENEKLVQIVTERVQPLTNYLNESKDNDAQKLNEISWGLHQIATALFFLNNDCKLVHNNVNISTIYVNRAGDWKLAGFEYAHSTEDQNVNPYKVLNTLDCYEPPEKNPANNIHTNRNSLQNHSGAVDAYGLGCLIWEIFNGILPNAGALRNPGKIPKNLVAAYNGLMNQQPGRRLSPEKFIKTCQNSEGFMDNPFVETLLFLEQIQIKDLAEKTKFFAELTPKLDNFPRNLCLYKIFPELLNSFEFGNAGSSILPPLFKLGKLLEESEYQKKLIPIVVKLFSSSDRATRMKLLQQLNQYVEFLTAGAINDQIFPNICQGFTDTNPSIRENTIRAIVLLAPKLNYNNLNVELMKHFARLQGQDEQGMIRTNTTVCIGKIAIFINPQLRQRILLSAFPKAMRDPYPLARLSGIVALANTDRFYTLRDIASKVLPSLCMLTIDPEKDVRDEAFKTIKLYTAKLEKVSENPELAMEMEKEVTSCTMDLKNETSWSTWAMSSLSAKMTGLKTKDKQPSVALNTQPLAAPVKERTEKTPEKSTQPDKPKVQATIKSPGLADNQKPSMNKLELESNISNDNFTSGWGDVDDDNWKDLDDDNDLMEPLEPTPAPSNSNSNFMNQSEPFSSPKSQQQPTDWADDWASSFEPTTKPKLNLSTKKAATTVTKTTASYNWSQSTSTMSSASNEEDLFASLVKDVKPKPAAKLKSSASKASNDDWGNDWSDVLSGDSKKSSVADKKSKPLKLGQKKTIFD